MGSDIAQVKAMLRAQFRAVLEDMEEDEKAWSDQALTEQFLAHPEVEKAQTVLLYYGVGTEIDTKPIIEAMLKAGKTVCLPKCLEEKQMQAQVITGFEDLKPDAYNIPAPVESCPVKQREELDLILVPGLCFDSHGSRLGQGGGYYDRYLEDYEGVTIGLCREDFLQAYLPREPLDEWVKYVLTEDGQVWPNR